MSRRVLIKKERKRKKELLHLFLIHLVGGKVTCGCNVEVVVSFKLLSVCSSGPDVSVSASVVYSPSAEDAALLYRL